MNDASAPDDAWSETDVTLKGPWFALSFRARVPAGPTTPDQLLPLAQALSDEMVRQACSLEEAAGRRVTCASGCGACCRGLVAISQVEARHMATLVDAMPDPRRTAVQARFADARQRLQAAGLLDRLDAPETWTPDEFTQMVARYFAAGVPCPFLEQESCSIYADRPLTCREFLVTSDPAHCAVLCSPDVVPVTLPLAVFNAVARWGAGPQGAFEEQWVPLVVAPDWARAHPDTQAPKAGLALLQELLACLSEPGRRQHGAAAARPAAPAATSGPAGPQGGVQA